MRTIVIENLEFDKCDDPVQTEEIISKNLMKHENQNLVSNNYIYVSIPLAWAINNYGLQAMQHFISDLSGTHDDYKKKENKLVFVCQHIQVKNIDFGNNIVFTPHSTVYDRFIPIPHHAPNKTDELKKYKDRKNLISFVGSYSTHPCRADAAAFLDQHKSCFSVDTGDWHFYKKGEELKKSSEFYVKSLNDSKISLCPRGTGPSTIRLWESMAMGTVPMIISDSLKLPMEDKIAWKDLVIRVSEKEAGNLEKYIPTEEDLLEMSENCIETYKKYFIEDKMHEIVLGELVGKI